MLILRERALKSMERYEERNTDIIYAHMLDSSIWKTMEDKRPRITNEMIIGEILHQGVGSILDPVESKCKTLHVSIDGVEKEVIERFVKQDEEGYYVKVCGTADAFYEGYPVELKTTRNGRNIFVPRKEWVRRVKLYAWLYGKKKGYLIILNVITGDEANYEVDAYTEEEIREVIEKWLRGEFPRNTLHPTVRVLDNTRPLI